MKVSELAKTAGVSPQTIRYYEREGLLDEPVRSAAGYRDYNANAVNRLRFIMDAKAIGFTLNEIRQLMGLDNDAPQSCHCVHGIVCKKLDTLEQQLKVMRHMQKRLEKLKKHCEDSHENSPCPILEILDS